MTREEFTAKTRDQAAARANGRCEKCGLPFNGARPEYDHILPADYGGLATLANCQVLCRFCHAEKSARDVRGMRKADRMRRSHNGAELPKQPIAARPKHAKQPSDKLPVPPPRGLYERVT